MAGAAEYLDDLIRKYENNIRVLSDESHVEYLDGLLRIAQKKRSHSRMFVFEMAAP